VAWTRYFFYRSNRLRTTWTFRLVLLLVIAMMLRLTSGWWTAVIGRSLVCSGAIAKSDAILVENFDSEYLLFERASHLRQAGFAGRVLVPVSANPARTEVNDVALGTTELMARIAHLGAIDVVPIREVEPISLNAAKDVRQFVERAGIRSLLVVTPLFRSRRSALVYSTVLGPAGVSVTCDPAPGLHTTQTWPRSWHGIQDVVEQWGKLQYYRWYVLRFYGI
jgi:hypothetical protein